MMPNAPITMSLAEMPRDARMTIIGRIVELLTKNLAFAEPRRWKHACVVLRGPGDVSHVSSRSCFAAWLRSNDMHGAAKECMHRNVPPGHILVWLDVESSGLAVSFQILPLAKEIKALT